MKKNSSSKKVQNENDNKQELYFNLIMKIVRDRLLSNISKFQNNIIYTDNNIYDEICDCLDEDEKEVIYKVIYDLYRLDELPIAPFIIPNVSQHLFEVKS